MRKIVKVANGYITFDLSPGIEKKIDGFIVELDGIASGLKSDSITVLTAQERLARRFEDIFGEGPV